MEVLQSSLTDLNHSRGKASALVRVCQLEGKPNPGDSPTTGLPLPVSSANNARHMKRLWPVLALLLVAASSPDETRQYRVAQAAFQDKLYDVAERQLQEFLE